MTFEIFVFYHGDIISPFSIISPYYIIFQFGIISPCFYTEFFMKILFNRITKAKNIKD